MVIYIVNFTSIFVYWLSKSWINKLAKKGSVHFTQKNFLYLICFQLILLLSARNLTVGLDTISYYNRFYYFGSLSIKEIIQNQQELGFSFLMKIVYFFGGDFQIFLLVTSIIIILPVIYIINKYSSIPFLSVALYLCFDHFAFSFSGIRQALAMGFCVFSYKYINEKKFFKFLLLVFVASLFHKSALFFIPAYLVNYTEIKLNTISTFVVVSGVSYLGRYSIYSFVESNLFRTIDNYYAARETGAYMWYLLVLIITLVCFAVYNPKAINAKLYRHFTLLLSIGAILMIFSMVGSNSKRLAEYYSIFSIFAIPHMITSIRYSRERQMISAGVFICIVALFIWTLTANQYNTVPYFTFRS